MKGASKAASDPRIKATAKRVSMGTPCTPLDRICVVCGVGAALRLYGYAWVHSMFTTGVL